MGRINHFRLLSIAGAFFSGFWLPLRLIGFHPGPVAEILFDLLLPVIAATNLHLHFHDRGTDPRRIRSWLNPSVVLDLLVLLPISLVSSLVWGAVPVSILIANLFMVRHVRYVQRFLDSFDSLQPVTYRLIPMATVLPLVVHLIACGWIALGSGSSGTDADPLVRYVKAIYWAFSTLTTVGYGDIVPQTPPQMLFVCAIQVIGVAVFGFIVSNVAGLLARSDAAREHHMDNLDKIETFMKIHAIPPFLRLKTRSYYHYMWTNKKGYRDDALLNDLPVQIQSELILHMNKPIIEKVSFLKGATAEFVGELMGKMRSRVYVPGERIFRVDEVGDALYLIQNGSVEIIGRDEQLIATLHDGTVFGEMALISDNPRAATARASTFCDIYFLPRHDFEAVTLAYPEFGQHLRAVMAAREAA